MNLFETSGKGWLGGIATLSSLLTTQSFTREQKDQIESFAKDALVNQQIKIAGCTIRAIRNTNPFNGGDDE